MARNATGKGRPVTRPEIDRALDLRALGYSWRKVGETLDRSPNAIRNAVITVAPDEHEEALERWRDRIREERVDRAFDRNDKWSAKFLDDIAQEQLPEVREARRDVNAPSAQEVHADRIREALERFTAAVLSQPAEGAAALPAGESE